MTRMADFDRVKQTLGLSEIHEVFRPAWQSIQALHDPMDGPFFDHAALDPACDFLAFPTTVREAIFECLAQMKKTPAIEQWAWQAYALLFLRERHHFPIPQEWPMLPETWGIASDLMYAVVLLAGLPNLRAAHRARRIPETITRDTLSDLLLWIREFHKQHHRYGFDKMSWLARHFESRLLKLGRLQFELRCFSPEYRFFRHTRNGQVVALAAAGKQFRADGQYDGVNGVYDVEYAWTAQYAEDASGIHGNPVSTDGRALRDTVYLPRSEWHPVFAPMDLSLGVHIPATGRLQPEECEASFLQAAKLFPQFFPEHPARAFECDSWLLDHQLAHVLSPESNIVRFQRMFYLLPAPGASDAQPLERVFDSQFSDVWSAPQNTSLQRHFVAYMKRGGRWRNALGVRLLDDVQRGPAVSRAVTDRSAGAMCSESEVG